MELSNYVIHSPNFHSHEYKNTGLFDLWNTYHSNLLWKLNEIQLNNYLEIIKLIKKLE